MVCPSCSAEIPDGSASCPACGRPRPFPRESQWSASPPAWIWILLGCAALGCLTPLLAAAVFATWALSRD